MRTSKHAPSSLPSNRPVSRLRQSDLATKKKFRDPRFDIVSQGESSSQHFRQNYSFLASLRQKELQEVRTANARAKKRIRSTPSDLRADAEVELQDLEYSQKRLESQVALDKEQTLNRKIQQQLRVTGRSSERDSKKRRHPRKGEIKRELLVAKFEDLRNRKGAQGVERIINSRRRKLSQRSQSDP